MSDLPYFENMNRPILDSILNSKDDIEFKVSSKTFISHQDFPTDHFFELTKSEVKLMVWGINIYRNKDYEDFSKYLSLAHYISCKIFVKKDVDSDYIIRFEFPPGSSFRKKRHA